MRYVIMFLSNEGALVAKINLGKQHIFTKI